MTILRGELQTDNGDRLYPHTSSQCVFAPDGKTVDQQITDFSPLLGRGYLNSPEVTNLDNVELNGKYRFRSDKVVGAPIKDNGILDVTVWDTNFGVQEIVYPNGERWSRTWLSRNPLTFTPWTLIATTDKIDITLLNGWKEQYDTWNSTALNIVGDKVSGSIWIRNDGLTKAWVSVLTITGVPIISPSRPVVMFNTATQINYFPQFNNINLAPPIDVPAGDYIIIF